MIWSIEPANRDLDHDAINKIGKQTSYCKDFGSIMFSGEGSYIKGWIRVAKVAVSGVIAGFSCVRHKVRAPETMLYFIAVDDAWHGEGIGKSLMEDLEKQTPHNRIALKVEKTNEHAIAFYIRLGYIVESTNEYGGKGILMAKEMAATYMNCGEVEQYKAINKPYCGCAGCWQKWTEKQQRETAKALERTEKE